MKEPDSARLGALPILRFLTLTLIPACAGWSVQSPVLAAPTADMLLANQPLTAELVVQTADPARAAEQGSFSAALLQQYVLVEYSAWRLAGPQLPVEATLRVYEMLDSPAALGLYSLALGELGPEAQRLAWGLDAEADHDQLIFWQGNFFFALRTANGQLGSDALRDWVTRVARRVEHPTVYPMTVVQLPETGLIRESIRFYLTDEALRTNPDFPAPLLGVLGFENRAEVASARYQPSGRTLFMIGYPTATLAADRFSEIQNRLQSVFSEAGIFLKRSGLLISLIEAPDEEARTLLDRVRYTATVKWIYEKETSLEDAQKRRGELVTFFGIISTSLLFTGLFMILMVLGGIAVGALRYRFLQRFPQWRARDDMIRLDLERGPTR